jgi:hypothetical protein
MVRANWFSHSSSARQKISQRICEKKSQERRREGGKTKWWQPVSRKHIINNAVQSFRRISRNFRTTNERARGLWAKEELDVEKKDMGKHDGGEAKHVRVIIQTGLKLQMR